MFVLLEEPEAWSLMMLVSAVAMDNAEISNEARDAIRRWRSDRPEKSPQMVALTEAINKAVNKRLDAKFMRRVKDRGWYETVRK